MHSNKIQNLEVRIFFITSITTAAFNIFYELIWQYIKIIFLEF